MYPKLIRLAILSQYQLVNMNIYRKGHKHNLFAYNLEKKGEHLMLLSNNIKCRALVSMPCSLIFWLVHFSFYFKLITWECKCTMHFRRLGNSTTKLKLYQQKKKKPITTLEFYNSPDYQTTEDFSVTAIHAFLWWMAAVFPSVFPCNGAFFYTLERERKNRPGKEPTKLLTPVKSEHL